MAFGVGQGHLLRDPWIDVAVDDHRVRPAIVSGIEYQHAECLSAGGGDAACRGDVGESTATHVPVKAAGFRRERTRVAIAPVLARLDAQPVVSPMVPDVIADKQ